MPQLETTANSLLAQRLAHPVLEAIVQAKLPSLGSGPQNPDLARILQQNQQLLAPGQSLTHNDLLALRAALWLLAGDLDQSHSISQNLQTPLGSFWHGVMHRREGDFSNAKYWFQRCTKLPFLRDIAMQVNNDTIASQLEFEDGWCPFQFVDKCQAVNRKSGTNKHDQLQEQCLRAQWLEWQIAVIS